MAIAEYTTIGGGLVVADKRALRRFIALQRGAVTKKRSFYRPSELAVLPSYSQLPQAADAWNLLSSGDKSDWNTVAAIFGLHGYNLFVQDKVYRLMHSIAGNATPSLNHQYLVGQLHIPASAGDVTLRQTGNFAVSFPATLYLRRKAVLEADPAGGEYLKLRFSYTYNEGAGEQTCVTEIVSLLSDIWGTQSSLITQHSGVLGPWTLEILAHAVKGDLYFDDVWTETPTDIIANDPNCDEAGTKWTPVVFPAGCTIESIYPQGGAL